MRFDSDLVVEFASDCLKNNKYFEDIEQFGVLLKKINLMGNEKYYERQGIYFDIPTCENEKNMQNVICWCIEQFGYDLSKVLVVGLGNAKYICDALGELVIDNMPLEKENLAKFKPLVKKLTGIESFELVKAVLKVYNPKTLILIDSLATKDCKRLANRLQITNVGLTPGSGVGNSRKFMDKKNFGVDVISIGVPLVANLIVDNKNILMTPIDIEDKVKNIARIICQGILNATK